MVSLDRTAVLNFTRRTSAKELCKQRSIECGTHENELQMWSLGQHIAQNDEQEICVQITLVNLVNKNMRHAVQVDRIVIVAVEYLSCNTTTALHVMIGLSRIWYPMDCPIFSSLCGNAFGHANGRDTSLRADHVATSTCPRIIRSSRTSCGSWVVPNPFHRHNNNLVCR